MAKPSLSSSAAARPAEQAGIHQEVSTTRPLTAVVGAGAQDHGAMDECLAVGTRPPSTVLSLAKLSAAWSFPPPTNPSAKLNPESVRTLGHDGTTHGVRRRHGRDWQQRSRGTRLIGTLDPMSPGEDAMDCVRHGARPTATHARAGAASGHGRWTGAATMPTDTWTRPAVAGDRPAGGSGESDLSCSERGVSRWSLRGAARHPHALPAVAREPWLWFLGVS